MTSILKLSISNIKHKKMQSIFIIALILISTISFATSIGILVGINDPYQSTHEQLNASHMLFILDRDIYNSQEIIEYWETREHVTGVTEKIPMQELSYPLINGEKRDIEFYATEAVESFKYQDKVAFVEGDEKNAPDINEIWINTGLAYGEDIKIGDVFELPTSSGYKQLKVSGIVVDATFSTPMITPTRIFVAPGFLSENFNKNTLDTSFVGVRMDSFEHYFDEIAAFESYLGNPFYGYIYDYDMVESSYIFLLQLIGIILIVFSVILMAISCYVLFSVISDSIVSEYRNIGIAKLIGFTPANVTVMYMMQIMVLAVVGIIFGLIASYYTIELSLASFVKALGIANNAVSIYSILIGSGMLLLTLIGVFSFIISIKASKVKPAEAIRYGELIDNGKASSFRISGKGLLPLTMKLSINQMLNSKKQSLFTLIAIMAAVFVMLFSINTFESVKGMMSSRDFFGFDASHVTIESNGASKDFNDDMLMEYLHSENEVEDYSKMGWFFSTVVPAVDDLPPLNIVGTVHDKKAGFIGYDTLQGKNPVNRDEIALSIKTSDLYNKEIGDNFQLFVQGALRNFEIVGIYQSPNDMGHGYRLYRSAAQGVPLDTYLIKLKDTASIKSFIQKSETQFGKNIVVFDSEEQFAGDMEDIILGVGSAIGFITLIFLSMLILTLTSSSILYVHKNKRILAMYKTIGLSPNQLRMILVFKNIVLAVAAAIIMTPITLMIVPIALKVMFSSTGIIMFPSVINWFVTILSMPLVLGIVFLSTWIPSRKMSELKLRILLEV